MEWVPEQYKMSSKTQKLPAFCTATLTFGKRFLYNSTDCLMTTFTPGYPQEIFVGIFCTSS